MFPSAHDLIGCDWGKTLIVPGVDEKLCMNQATQRIQLYQDGEPLPLMKLCHGHAEFVKTQSDAR